MVAIAALEYSHAALWTQVQMVVKGLSEGEESTPRPETSRGDRMAESG